MWAETAKKLTSSKEIAAKRLVPDFNNMDSLGLIEVKYIKNLQKQVFLLECETSYLEKARKATSIQPKITKEAAKMLQKMKELETTINTAKIEIAKRENTTKVLETEAQAILKRLQTLSDANTREKLVLMEDAMKLKCLGNKSTQDISNKEAELLKIQREVQQTINAVKEKEHDVHMWESQLQQQFQQHQDTKQKFIESSSECIQLQVLLHQLEEKFLTSSQSMQQHIAKDLREETEKLKQALQEKGLSADEDKYLRNKMTEDCGHLTRENGHLQAQVLEATRQLIKERQLREEESTSHSRRASEMASERERERQLEMELTYLKAQLQDEKQKILQAQEKVLHLQQEWRPVDQNGQFLQAQLTNLKEKHARLQLENSKLCIEKSLLVERISHLHKQIAEKEKDINFLQSQVNSLSHDVNHLKSQVDVASVLQKEKWRESSSVSTANHVSIN